MCFPFRIKAENIQMLETLETCSPRVCVSSSFLCVLRLPVLNFHVSSRMPLLFFLAIILFIRIYFIYPGEFLFFSPAKTGFLCRPG